ncbi:hypothetical protein GA0074694_1812 [Micromonospora inyonensis]|uniref:Uncharacterized protein n=2 Tax=Micromonospora inyonensis TaxID=47866 RepID=A0A1C6RIF3_9ACTN|nr:hypothetical protein GA0074694_1812 [Micromonospora inyonensis]
MLAQLDGGIAEEARNTTKNDKRTEAGVKGFAGHYQGWGEENYTTKSLGDALFPTLEDALDSSGLIKDLSDQLQSAPFWTSTELRESTPPGTLVRIAAPGSLFDARYVAASLAGFASTHSGLEGIGAATATSSSPPARQGKGRPARAKGDKSPETINQLEDTIPDFNPMRNTDGSQGIGPEFFRGLVKIARGLFTPGLHLNLYPTDNDTHSIGVRLQEGRQFLDGDPEILFARYGTGNQNWTVVGTIGHYANAKDRVSPEYADITDGAGQVVRGRTAAFVNSYMRFLGALGFADVPQWPGFNVVPLAVYRIIASSASEVEAP